VELEEIDPSLRGRVYSIPHGPLGISSGRGVPWEPGCILFFGRIERYKGLGYLLDAMDILASKGVTVRLVVAGRGGDLERHRRRIEENPSVELLEGFIPREEVRDLMLRANVVAMPYTDATQSGVAAMAIGYGRPVVASDVGSVGETVREGETGLLVPPRDSQRLAAALQRFVEDQPFATACANNALALADREYSWRSIGEQTSDVYRHVMESGTRR